MAKFGQIPYPNLLDLVVVLLQLLNKTFCVPLDIGGAVAVGFSERSNPGLKRTTAT